MRVKLFLLCLAPALVVGACATTPGRAKASGIVQSGPGCLDTLTASDTVKSAVVATLTPQDSTTSFPSNLDSVFVAALKGRFRIPDRLQLRVVTGWEPCDSAGTRCAGGILNLGVASYFTAHRDGRLTRISLVDATLTPTVVESLNRALRKLSSDRAAKWTGPPDSIPIELRLTQVDASDSISVSNRFFTSLVPHYDLPFTSSMMPSSGVEASYPISAELAGVGDTVEVAFTVDADGEIAPESMEVLSAKYRDFVASVARALLETRYHPARLGDCPVAARTRQRFVFTGRD